MPVSKSKASTGYRWIDKDPVIDAYRAAFEQSEMNLPSLAEAAGVAPSTLYAWDKGETKKPQHATIRSVMEALGYTEQWIGRERKLVVDYKAERGEPSFSFKKL